jgi:hypothetical protein
LKACLSGGSKHLPLEAHKNVARYPPTYQNISLGFFIRPNPGEGQGGDPI